MKGPEGELQEWVWTGFNEGKFNPDGDLSIDDDEDDVFIGTVFSDEDDFQIGTDSLTVTMELPEALTASLTGKRLDEVVELPTCGDEDLDARINAKTIKSVATSKDEVGRTQIKMTIG
jgi:hypothetical protein